MKRTNLYTPIFLAAFLMLAWSYYAFQRSSAVECKTTAVYSTNKINRSELDGLRFNVLGVIGTDLFSHRKVQKNSLLINADDASMTMVSQIRVADVSGESDILKIKGDLRGALEKISGIYGFPLLNSSIICDAPPKWYRLYTPSFLLIVLIACFVLIKSQTASRSR